MLLIHLIIYVICDDDSNSEQLADQVFNLPREYRPIILSEACTIMNNEIPPPTDINISTLRPLLPLNIKTTNYDDHTLTEFKKVLPTPLPPLSPLRAVVCSTMNAPTENTTPY